MRPINSAAKGVAFLSVAHVVWVSLAIVFGRLGLRLASSSSNPSLGQIALQQMRDLLIPFFPAALICGVFLGLVALRIHSSYRMAAIGAIAAPLAFVMSLFLVTSIVKAASTSAIGYAAEQGMAILGYVIIAPILGLTASPLWAIAAGLLKRSVNKITG